MQKSLQESLDSCLFIAVKKLDRCLDRITDEAFKKYGLSQSHSTILLTLYYGDGLLQKELAKALCITAPTLTRLLEKLLNRGFISIVSQGRTKRVYLTDKGKELIPIIRQANLDTLENFNRLIKDGFSETLISDLNQITNQLSREFY